MGKRSDTDDADDFDSDWEDPDQSDQDDENDEGDDGIETVPCPYCGRHIYEEAERCPHCGSYVSTADTPTQRRWIVFVALLLLAAVIAGTVWIFAATTS